MDSISLPQFQYELSLRDGVRKFHYKPPDTIGDLSKVFPFIPAMNNCSPKFNTGMDDKVSSSQVSSDKISGDSQKDGDGGSDS